MTSHVFDTHFILLHHLPAIQYIDVLSTPETITAHQQFKLSHILEVQYQVFRGEKSGIPQLYLHS